MKINIKNISPLIWKIVLGCSVLVGLIVGIMQLQKWHSESHLPLNELRGLIYDLMKYGEVNDPDACLKLYQFPVKKFFILSNVSYVDAVNERTIHINQWPIRAYSLTKKPELIREFECDDNSCYSMVSTFVYHLESKTERRDGKKTVEYLILRNKNGELKIFSITEYRGGATQTEAEKGSTQGGKF